MREILFRGKRGKQVDNGKWVYGDLIHISTDDFAIWGFDNHTQFVSVIPETVCQYTGLKDKNGTRIFEHDIVETKYGRICEVVRVSLDTFCGWDLIPIGKYDCKAPDKWDLWSCDNLVVMGNIFDNLDLWEDKNARDTF